jgi:hypothetical protein
MQAKGYLEGEKARKARDGRIRLMEMGEKENGGAAK